MNRGQTIVILFILFSITFLNAQTNPHYRYLSINEIQMWVSNTGDGSYNPNTIGPGFTWPGGILGTKTAVYEDGLLYGGKINGQIRVNGNNYREGLQPGILFGDSLTANPNDSTFKIWRLLKGWELLPASKEKEDLEFDYNNWPVRYGAPWKDMNENNIYDPGIDLPDFVGDEVLFYVANDKDPVKTNYVYGCLPFGLEFQTSIYGFDSSNFLGDVVFKKYLIINKSLNSIDTMFISYWADPDLGNPFDDFDGCERTLNLGYAYNSINQDEIYGTPPPAVGHMLVQGPIVPSVSDSAFFKGSWRQGFKNLPMTAFSYYNGISDTIYGSPHPGTYQGALEMYCNMQGLTRKGYPYVNPLTQFPTTYCVDGDPESGIGWFEGAGWPGGFNASDRMFALSSGPFNMAPGDTQEVIIAIFTAQGNSNLNSVTELKNKGMMIHQFMGNSSITGIAGSDQNIPSGFVLQQNYPNPFNPATNIEYSIPMTTNVELKVYDVLGNEIQTLTNKEQQPGSYRITFNSNGLASGVYIYQLRTDTYTSSKKMLILK